MGYADGLLTSGERVVHREKQHWWVFVWGAKWTIIAVIVALILFVLRENIGTEGIAGAFRTILGWGAAAVIIGGIGLLIWTTLRYLSQEYVLTNRRVIETEGVINKRAVDSSLEKINDAVLTQSIFGRAFGFGDLKVLTASEGAISEFRMIQRPIQFKKAMLEAKHELELEVAGSGRDIAPPLRATPAAPAAATAATAPADAGAAPTGTGDETVVAATPAAPGGPIDARQADELTRALADLADLRDRGAITPEEYEREKADILARL